MVYKGGGTRAHVGVRYSALTPSPSPSHPFSQKSPAYYHAPPAFPYRPECSVPRKPLKGNPSPFHSLSVVAGRVVVASNVSHSLFMFLTAYLSCPRRSLRSRMLVARCARECPSLATLANVATGRAPSIVRPRHCAPTRCQSRPSFL